MNDTNFIFVVIPALFCFVGGLFSLIFGPEVLRWYNAKKAVQQRQLARATPVVAIERYERDDSYAPVTRRSEQRELVTH
jgi:hypothetical protein